MLCRKFFYKLRFLHIIVLVPLLLLCFILNFNTNHDMKNNSTLQMRTLRAPDIEYENSRRKLFQDSKDFWLYLESKLNPLASEKYIENLLKEARSRHLTILSQLSEMKEHDGFDVWRQKEHIELSDLVQNRIFSIQNPKSCAKSKKLLCTLDDCGFGCQFHRIVLCLIISYATKRTLLLDTQNWSYSCDGEGSFDQTFHPISENCLLHRDYDISKEQIVEWPGTEDDAIIRFSFASYFWLKRSELLFLPPAVPQDLVDRIKLLHGNPPLWWISQFVKFLWKLRSTQKQKLKDLEKEVISNSILVGIHIRRSDKILEKETEYYSIEDYMKHAKEYFDQEQIRRNCTTCKLQVFVASDDSKVFEEIRNKYPEYLIIGDEKRATSAFLSSRYNSNSLSYLISDIHMLSLSDFIVCTLSSNVCKLAYEIQQLRYVDGSWRIHSLNNHWLNFGSSSSHDHAEQAIYSHTANTPEELSFDVGDTITDVGFKQNGYVFGILIRNNRSGFYPSYKTNQVIESYSFPTYSDVTSQNVQHLTPNERSTRKSTQSFGKLEYFLASFRN